MARKVFVWPDIHAPFHDRKAINKAYEIMEKEKPNVIINLGDIVDRFSFGRFSRPHDEMTPEEEIEEGRNFCIEFWNTINKINPKARKIQLLGNHCKRILRSCLDKYPEIYSIVKKHEDDFFKFKGVETVIDNRSELEIDGIVYTHGWASKLGDHARHIGKSVVRGHSHRLEMVYFNMNGGSLFEVAAGFLADEKRRALQYTPTMTNHWTKGVVVVDKRIPRLIPILK